MFVSPPSKILDTPVGDRCTYVDNEHVQVDKGVPAVLAGWEVSGGVTGLMQAAVETDQLKVYVDIPLSQLHSPTYSHSESSYLFILVYFTYFGA